MAISLKEKTISSKVTEDELYLDPAKANSIEKDMVLQLKKIAQITERSYKLLKKAETSKHVKGNLVGLTTKAKKGLKTRSKRAKEINKKLTSSYTSDTQEYVTQFLTKTIGDLEKRIAALEKNNG